MIANSSLKRTSKNRPCPICGSIKWCSFDEFICVCMHEAQGAIKETRNGGFLHRLKDDPNFRPQRHRPIVQTVSHPDYARFSALATAYTAALTPARRHWLACNLGVSTSSLTTLGLGWTDEAHAFAFPMTDAAGRVRGIRLRRIDGFKFSVAGGAEGLFIPTTEPQQELFITEGATDAAALLDLQFWCIGRPSAEGGTQLLIDFVQRRKPAQVVIVADFDERGTGQRGAAKLGQLVAAYCRDTRLIIPPPGTKDAREWKRRGATRDTIAQAVRTADQIQLQIRGAA